ncbi:RNB domain-containing ribonuclease [Pseudoclavibacter alba]|uniref:RNB domain-containing ribonuclease n=1 Tax=Pseudoclavibacter albus TaxID=272241 RepID=UPI0019D31BA8|nr:RNB domain-containing ribonuclease [Pseudoclavibacter alba]MBN6777111.1 RNB domain-containing ribonuclease [Pseudoclavibacter alba]
MRGVHATALEFDDVRDEFKLPHEFPAEVEAAAAAAHDRFAAERRDARDIPFVTIDPPGSKDLDQAVHVIPTESGFRLSYAIADVGAFVALGDPIDEEARKRGQTMYLPDGSTPLHPRVLSEDRASLVEGEDRPCALWTIETDERGVMTSGRVERAIIHSTARLDYQTVQQWFDEGRELPEALTGLKGFGEARSALAIERGAIELSLPAQEIVQLPDGGWTVRNEARTQVDDWNAQCSLATGHVAATIMLRGGTGILRTLDAATPDTEAEFRAACTAIGMPWPEGIAAGAWLATLPRDDARTLAVHTAATRLLRGAGYVAFDGELPPENERSHAGVADLYAHATAPLRRLADRFAIECCLAIDAGREVDPELAAALPEVAKRMEETNRTASAVEREALSKGEALALASRVGEEFEVAVTRGARDGGKDGNTRPAEVLLLEPSVTASCDGSPQAGTTIRVRLTEADPAKRRVRFTAL